MLTVIDEYTKECLAIDVARNLKSTVDLKRMRFAWGSKTLSASMADATVSILKIIGVARVLESFDDIMSCTIVQPGRSAIAKASIYGKRAAFIPNQRRG